MIVEYKKQMTKINEQIRPNLNKHTETEWRLPEGEGLGVGGEKNNCMVTEENSVFLVSTLQVHKSRNIMFICNLHNVTN